MAKRTESDDPPKPPEGAESRPPKAGIKRPGTPAPRKVEGQAPAGPLARAVKKVAKAVKKVAGEVATATVERAAKKLTAPTPEGREKKGKKRDDRKTKSGDDKNVAKKSAKKTAVKSTAKVAAKSKKTTAKDKPARKSSTDKSAPTKKAANKAAVKPAAKKATKKSTAKKPTAKKPTAKKAATKKTAARKPAAKRPATKKRAPARKSIATPSTTATPPPATHADAGSNELLETPIAPSPPPRVAEPAAAEPMSSAAVAQRTRLVLMVREPGQLYLYWRFSPEDVARHNIGARFGTPMLTLRVRSPRSGHIEQQIPIVGGSDNWHVHVPAATHDWQADLGYFSRDGFVTICESNAVEAPGLPAADWTAHEPRLEMPDPNSPSVEHEPPAPLAEEGRPDGTHLTPPERAESPTQHARHEVAPTEPGPTRQDRETHPPEPAGDPHLAPATEASQPPAHAAVADAGRRMRAYPASLPPGVERLPPGYAGSQVPVAPPDWEALGEGAPSEPQAAPGKDFWLVVATELVVHGRTEPDARVTLMGQPVKLARDGSFSLRIALPDGDYAFPVHATSADGERSREIAPLVKRWEK